MKSIPSQMQDHLDGEVTFLCRCWLLTRTDGLVQGFTDHDEGIDLDGVECLAVSGLEASNIEASLGLNVNNQEVLGALQSASISAADIEAGKLDGAVVQQFVVNWRDPSQRFVEHEHVVGDIIREDGVFRAELRSHTAQLDHSKGRHFVKHCQADLGDESCRVDLGNAIHASTGAVIGVGSPIVLEVFIAGEFTPGQFRGGLLTWTNGANANVKVEIAEHLSELGQTWIHLWKPMANLPETGDAFSIVVGCDKTFRTCREKFQNGINFQGFPHMPGNDFASNYAANSGKMDGGALVK